MSPFIYLYQYGLMGINFIPGIHPSVCFAVHIVSSSSDCNGVVVGLDDGGNLVATMLLM